MRKRASKWKLTNNSVAGSRSFCFTKIFWYAAKVAYQISQEAKMEPGRFSDVLRKIPVCNGQLTVSELVELCTPVVFLKERL